MLLNRRTVMLLGWFGAVFVASSLLVPQQAHARKSSPSILQHLQPMRVQLVRDAQPGCDANCAEWISAEGDIVEGTPAAFQQVLRAVGNRKLPVFVNSGGGSIEAAIAIGRMLRDRKLDVAVTKTDFDLCPPASKGCKGKRKLAARGKPNSYNAYCASACTLLLAAGDRRLVSPWSRVGVHQIIVFKTQYRIRRTYRVTTTVRPGGHRDVRRHLIREQRFAGKTTPGEVTENTYRPIDEFLKEMGIGQALIPLMEATPNSSIHWMSREELASTGMATEESSGDVLLRLAQAVPVQPAVSTPASSISTAGN